MAMNTTVNYTTSPAVTTNPTSEAPSAHLTEPFRVALIIIYTAVLLVGITGLSVMISLLKTNIRSLTTIAFLNLMVAHFLFLLTVPFRIYYYVSQTWKLGHGFCKLVSAMVHIHIYMVFTIYSILLTVRFLHFYKKTQRTEFYRRLHGLGASALVWFILLIIMLPVVLKQYGHGQGQGEVLPVVLKQYGHEHGHEHGLGVFIYIFIITVSCLQTCIQVIILRSMILKYGPACRSQQEFWVQIKNLSFVLIMLTCLVPYHLFRLQYMNYTKELHQINEVFLAITGLTCFDMLTFTGKNIYKVCWTR
ncbi:probable G-protein coupled receptor 141 [Cyprinus carpio]|uniref:Probable G-protein coupled receptor 141 n=1 Tax=Cyprinus carpio TaxID=7962 RepID=A0A9Q9ZH56_CYPCA|nr:probable G-protein coupled receptor 141 [Cyprinus carpio]XP_042607924.1 probable G-protein coupled receptor 141 [Cyprinus carpio]